MGYFEGAFVASEEVKVIWSDGGIDGWRVIGDGFPVGKEFVKGSGFEAVATEYMITDFGAFFDETDVDGLAMLSLFLFEFDGSRQAGDSSSDDNDVVLHLLARREFGGEGETNICLKEGWKKFFGKYSDHLYWIKIIFINPMLSS